jgi:glycosyltransferase involved in cell wall biosynthesis
VRILNLSNFYPPLSLGGFEQWCQEVTDGLRARGHDVAVLTSRHAARRETEGDPSWVHRRLHLEMELASLRNAVRFFTAREREEREDLDCLTALVDAFDPDVVLIWGMWNLHRSVPALAERLRPGRVAYYAGDYWPTLPSQFEPYWRSPARNLLAACAKAPLRAVALRTLARERRPTIRFERVMFPTAFVRDELSRRGFRPREGRLVPGAIDTGPYLRADASPRPADPDHLRLLCVGRLTADKGMDTAVEALGLLVGRHGLQRVSLAIAGSGDDTCRKRLEILARQRRVDGLIRFLGSQPKSALPGIYRDADVFLFTSVWPEPFGRVLVEAMASGLAVVGASTGGAAEILSDGLNALTFEAGDAEGLASQVLRLATSPELRLTLGRRGQQDAATRFDVGRMTAEIEDFLRQVTDEGR